MNRKRKRRPYSISRRIYWVMYILMGLEIICFSAFSFYASMSFRRQRFADLKQTLALYDAQISDSLFGIDYYLMQVAQYSSEYSQATVQTADNKDFTGNVRLQNLLEYNLRSFPGLEGMIAYFPLSDTFISAQNYESSRRIFHEYLRQQMADEEGRKKLDPGGGIYWNVLEYDETTYLVSIFNNKNSYAGAWTNLDRLSDILTEIGGLQTSVFFSDENGGIFPMRTDTIPDMAGGEDMERLEAAVRKTGEKGDYQIVRLGDCVYLLVQQELSISVPVIRTNVLVPVQDIDSSLRRYAMISVVILGVTLAAFILVERMLSRFMRKTTTMLGAVTEAIAAGREDERVNTDVIYADEMRQIGTSYNYMVDRVQSLKIEAYEENIQAKNFQLLALRSQVAPHFLINCLNMIGYMADGTEENTELIHQMVATLSQHLRYTLSTKERVPLSEEAEYEQNYVALTDLRFPGCLTFEMDISEEASRAMVFPLILIMFTENTFKYNLVMREPLKLIVRAYVYEKDGEKRLHIEHIDSGSGYEENVLQRGNEIASQEIAGSGGAQIGLRNIGQRLRLYYNDTAELKLSNEPGMGARNDIDIPYVEYNE
ncbi:MAG: histidine kinase [Lachnospiraceae bacterium]|nr:histidine kinase [Lachnospiraceae bacterium]